VGIGESLGILPYHIVIETPRDKQGRIRERVLMNNPPLLFL
jgi:hypothetical protein